MYISRISLFVLFHLKTVHSHIVLTHLFFESSISLRRHSSVDFSNPAPEDVAASEAESDAELTVDGVGVGFHHDAGLEDVLVLRTVADRNLSARGLLRRSPPHNCSRV